MKKIIDCFKEDNPVINKKLRKVSVDEGLKIAEELLNILSERKTALALRLTKWVLTPLLLWLMLGSRLY